jgi:hypothetical protein
MKEKNNSIYWTNSPTQRKADVVDMPLDQMIAILDEKSTPETANAFGEIKGLYTAYKLAPSNVLLEAMLAKCLSIIIHTEKDSINTCGATLVKSSRTHPASMDWEWVQGFEHFLMMNDITETSRQVYIRALKRVMKKNNINDVETLIRDIEWLIQEYSGCDQASHNVHISTLRQFKAYMNDECGYFFSIEQDGEEEIVSRIYCNFELAEQEFDGIVSDYCENADKIRMYDKFAHLIKEYKA